MQLKSNNLNKVRGLTLCYIEIHLQVVFWIWFCIPVLNLAWNNILLVPIRFNRESIDSGLLHISSANQNTRWQWITNMCIWGSSWRVVLKTAQNGPSSMVTVRNIYLFNDWVDADHVRYFLTSRSHMGVIVFIKSSPIVWYSKHQATIKSSTFGSEVVSMRTCLELLKELWYKLRMVGVPVDGP